MENSLVQPRSLRATWVFMFSSGTCFYTFYHRGATNSTGSLMPLYQIASANFG